MTDEGADNKGLEIIAGKVFPADNGLVDVVDFLNKSLKKDGYVFGVSKAGDRMTVVIYRTDGEKSRPCCQTSKK